MTSSISSAYTILSSADYNLVQVWMFFYCIDHGSIALFLPL